MVDVAKGRDQIYQLQDPNIIIMATGGNDIGFFEAADSCVFLSLTHDHSPQYENDAGRGGECTKAIDKTMSYLRDPELRFGFDLSRIFADLLGSKPAKADPDLCIYQTGYSQVPQRQVMGRLTGSSQALLLWSPAALGTWKPRGSMTCSLLVLLR